MQRQGSFLQAEYACKKKPTRRDKFLAEMEEVVAVGAAGAATAAALPKGRARPAANRAEAPAAGLLCAAVVRAGRRGGRGCLL